MTLDRAREIIEEYIKVWAPMSSPGHAEDILNALHSAGYKILPREPTQLMIDKATASNTYLYEGKVPPDAPPDHDYDDDVARFWRVMFDAAP